VKPTTKNRTRADDRKLAAMIADATVDCNDEADEVMGLLNMIDEQLELPFDTTILGVVATVQRVEMAPGNRIVAICVRGRARQPIGLLDLPLPTPRPAGAEWIDAYRHWCSVR
jgi:hypothetical protein